MQTQDLKRHHPQTKKKTIGRGGKRGTTSGRGTKGQRARAGHRMRPELRDTIKKLPKRRGYRFKSFAVKPTTISLTTINTHFLVGETISPQSLIAKGLIFNLARRAPLIKILGGTMDHPVVVKGCLVSASARQTLEAVGGSVK